MSLSPIPAYYTPKLPVLVHLDFQNNKTFAGRLNTSTASAALTCVRSAPVTVEDANGNAQTFDANVPALNYRGLLFNPATQQLLNNSKMLGGTLGLTSSGGAWPPGFSTQGSPNTVELISFDDYQGWPSTVAEIYVNNTDTVDHTYKVLLEPSNTLTATVADVFTLSAIIGIVSTDLANPQFSIRITPRDSSGNTIVGVSDARTAAPSTGFSRISVSMTMPASTVKVDPCLSFVVPASTAGRIRFRIAAPQFEKQAAPTAFLPTWPSAYSYTEKDTWPAPGGATVGGALPSGWNSTGFTSVSVTDVGSDYVTVTLNATNATGTSTSANIRLTPSVNAALAAASGETWMASGEFTVLSASTGTSPRLSMAGLNASGSSTESNAVNLPLTGTNVVYSTFTFANGATAYARSQVTVTVPASSSISVVIKMRNLSLKKRALSVTGTGQLTRDADAISLTSATLTSVIPSRTVVFGTYMAAPVGNATWLTMTFGTKVVKIYGGAKIGVVVTDGGTEVGRVEQAVAPYVFGRMRTALSWSAGSLELALPVNVGDFRKTLTLSVAGLDPTALSAVTLGTGGGPMRWLKFLRGSRSGPALAYEVQQSWAHPTVKSPRADISGDDIMTAANWAPTYPSSLAALLPDKGRLFSPTWASSTQNIALFTGVSNGAFKIQVDGGAFTSVGPIDLTSVTTFSGVASAVTSALAAAGLGATCSWYVSRFSITSNTTGAGSSISYPKPPSSGTDLSVLMRITELDGAGISNGVASCTYATIPGSDLDPPQSSDYLVLPDAGVTYETLGTVRPSYTIPVDIKLPSKYGPTSPDNLTRSRVDPCWNAIYTQQVDIYRKFQSYVVKAAASWLTGDRDAARAGLKLLYQFAQAGAFLGVKNETGYFVAFGQTGCAFAQAYAVLRNAGGTTQQHATIRAWLEAMVQQAIPHVDHLASNGSNSGKNNHHYWKTCFIVLVGCILNNETYMQRGVDCIKRALAGANPSGALPAEIARADHGALYSVFACIPLAMMAETLLATGLFDAYSYAGGQLKTVFNFAVNVVADPNLVVAEQTWMTTHGYSSTVVVPLLGESGGILPVPYQGGGTGEEVPQESSVAWILLPYRRMTTADAPWRPTWASRWDVYDDTFSTSMGGGVADIYVDPLL